MFQKCFVLHLYYVWQKQRSKEYNTWFSVKSMPCLMTLSTFTPYFDYTYILVRIPKSIQRNVLINFELNTHLYGENLLSCAKERKGEHSCVLYIGHKSAPPSFLVLDPYGE